MRLPFLAPRLAALALALALCAPAAALSTADLRRRAIYQLLTDRFATPAGDAPGCEPARRRYCGGGWKGVERELGWIQGMGFDTVWISPVVNNVPGVAGSESYHGYYTSNMFELNARFGTRQDLLDLSAALHARGMYLMVDVVANHVGADDPAAVPGDAYGPFTQQTDFHPFCLPTDWDNQTQVEKCWIHDTLADLDTESPRVVSTLYTWVRHLVATFGIDAVRVDTVKHVRADFWPGFMRAAGVGGVGEVLHGDPNYLRRYQETAMDSLLDYATFFHLRRAFASPAAHIDELVDFVPRMQRTMRDTSLLAAFLDNHDNPRFAGTVTDPVLVKNAAVYPFVSDGYPIVYSGQEHGMVGGEDPHNREAMWTFGFSDPSVAPLYPFFTALNRARRHALAHLPYLSTPLAASRLDNHTTALSKPPLVSVLTNAGSAAPAAVHYLPVSQTAYRPRMAVIDVLSGELTATDPQGGLSVVVVAGQPRVYIPLAVWDDAAAPAAAWMRETERDKAKAREKEAPARHARAASLQAALSWFGMGSSAKEL
ncbi:hypothetical protein Q5752_006655 [Cryptotrichosporon argae]